MRTIPEMHKLIKPDDDVIKLDLLLEQDQIPHALKAIQDAKMPGASWRLGVLPLTEFGFALNKGQFRDARGLRCGRPLKGLPAKRSFGKIYNVKHALNCKKGGFVTMRNNNLRDFYADMLSKIVNDVKQNRNCNWLQVKLLKIYPEMLQDPILKQKVWRAGQKSFFDVKVINTLSLSITDSPHNRKYSKEV